MPRNQEELARLVERERGVHPRVAEAFRTVAREDFVPEESRSVAYADRPIALPEDQTTSQPTLIARMIDSVSPAPTDRALEVGTGYGFQTALLARLVAEVFSIERHESLAKVASENLSAAGITNVRVVVGDGWEGLPAEAPFDIIIVSAAAEELPQALAQQLAPEGRMVVPIKGPLGDDVILFRKQAGEVERVRLVTPARFVPLVKGHGKNPVENAT